MSDETPINTAIEVEDEPIVEVPKVDPPKPKKRKPRKKAIQVVKDVAAVPKKVVEKVVGVITSKEEVDEEEVDEEPDYSYYPDGTCWLCKREGEGGANIDLRAGNGTFSLFMCGDCQNRFRKG